jgi:hypothetical protein
MENDPFAPIEDEALMRSFIAVTRAVFQSAAWEAVEPHVERAWRSIAWRQKWSWVEARDIIRAAWEQHP